MIRTRLTVWNAIVFALALTLIGTVVYATTRTMLYRAVEDDLAVRAASFQRMIATGPEGPGGPDGPGGHGGPDFLGGLGPLLFGQRGGHPPDGGHHGPPDEFSAKNSAITTAMITALGFDPIQAQRMEFNLRLGRPRLFLTDGTMRGRQETPFDSEKLKVAEKGERVFSITRIEDHRIRVLSVPLRKQGKIVGAAQIAASLDEVDAQIQRLGNVLLAMLPLSLAFTTLLGVWMTIRALKPVRDIAEAAEKIEATNLSDRLPVKGNDEFAVLSNRFNSMLDRIESSFMRLAQSYEAQRLFVADASHELKTPLTTVKGRVGVALRGTHSPERYGEHLRAIGRAADSMSAIIGDLLLLARSDESQLTLRREPYPLRELAQEAVSAATAANPREVEVDIPDNLRASVEAPLFVRALINLLTNATRHTAPEGRVAIRACEEGERLRIEIADTGEGIPSEHLPKIFDRFHRVDASRDRASGGTGLGLSIVRSIVEAHGGTVAIESEVGVGTRVIIDLPSVDE